MPSSGVNFDYPGVKVIEATRGAIPIDRTSFRSIKMVGTALRGPTGPYGPITRSAQFEEIYGPRTNTSYLDDAIRAVFENTDSSEVYVNRVVGAGAAKATVTLTGTDGTAQVETATVAGTITTAGTATL